MRSLTPTFLEKLRFANEQMATLRAIGDARGRQALYQKQTPDTLKSLQTLASIESVESSTRLEGITAARERIQAVVLHRTQPVGRSEAEIAGYRDALAMIHDSAQYMPFRENIIKQTHNVLYRYMPQDGGYYKSTQNDIAERNPAGEITRIRFRPTPPVETPQSMIDLIERYQQAVHTLQIEPLIVIPLAILDFLCVHPFPDGNGRTARLLTLLLLYHFDYQVGRYISLERIFETTKEGYYTTLEASSQGWHEGEHDAMPWLSYFWGVLLAAYKEFEERLGLIRGDHGSKTDLIKAAVQRKTKPFSISDLEQELPMVSRDMIRVVLRQLRDDNAIILQGRGRGAKWVKVHPSG